MDVTRVERGIREGRTRDEVFSTARRDHYRYRRRGCAPGRALHQEPRRSGPLRAHTSVPAAGIREVDLLRKYHRSATELAEALGISAPRSTVLRRHLRIDDDGPHSHGFVLGAVKQRRYSDNAWMPMRNTLETVDMDAVWKAHSPNRGARSWNTCELAGCQAGQA